MGKFDISCYILIVHLQLLIVFLFFPFCVLYQAKYKSLVKKHREGDTEEALIEDEEIDDEAFMEMAANLSKDERDSAWLEAVGGPSKGRVYGTGSEGPSIMQVSISAPTCNSSAPSHSTYREDANFKEVVQQAVAEQIADVKASFEVKMQAMQASLLAAIQAMQGGQPTSSAAEDASVSNTNNNNAQYAFDVSYKTWILLLFLW